MSSEFEEEVEAMTAIYPSAVQVMGPGVIILKVPDHEEILFQFLFPHSYPEQKPSLLKVIVRNVRIFPDEKYIGIKINEILDRIFQPDDVVMFDLIGEIEEFLNQEAKEREALDEKSHKMEPPTGQKPPKVVSSPPPNEVAEPEPPQRDVIGSWVISDTISDRGSTFIAFAREVHSPNEFNVYVDELKTDRKIARAAHNMTAMRIKGEKGVVYLDCDDDGETAAGLRMLHLLTVC